MHFAGVVRSIGVVFWAPLRAKPCFPGGHGKRIQEICPAWFWYLRKCEREEENEQIKTK